MSIGSPAAGRSNTLPAAGTGLTHVRYTELMKKIIFGIFAHPDDEAIGPAGTLLHETHGGVELHLIALTRGEGGMNPDNVDDLGTTRFEEWQKSGQLLGASSMHYLGFRDGHLDNEAMIEAVDKLTALITPIVQAAPENTEIEFVTFDLNGLTGHIDHIVTSRAACLAFYRFKTTDKRFKRILLNCLTREQAPLPNIDWVYMEQGRNQDEIDEIVDARHLHDSLLEIIRTHHSQRGDGEAHIKNRGENLGLNYFIVKD
jgi:LmbE family N-acetylglucosaminyl deacetylase